MRCCALATLNFRMHQVHLNERTERETHGNEENGSSGNSAVHASGGDSCINASGPAIGRHKDIGQLSSRVLRRKPIPLFLPDSPATPTPTRALKETTRSPFRRPSFRVRCERMGFLNALLH